MRNLVYMRLVKCTYLSKLDKFYFVRTKAIKCAKVHLLDIATLQLQIAKQMEIINTKYTKEWLRAFKGLENLSDIEADEAIKSLLSLQTTLMSLSLDLANSTNQNNNEQIQQAA